MQNKNDEHGVRSAVTFFVCLSLVILIGFTLLVTLSPVSPPVCGLIAVLLFLAGTGGYVLARTVRRSRRPGTDEGEDLAPALGSVMLDLITKIHFP